MKMKISQIETDLTSLLWQRFGNSILDREAIIEVQSSEDGIGFSFVPFEDRLARIDVVYENDDPIVYLTIANNTVLEVPIEGGRYTHMQGIEELLALIRGVLNNGFEEEIWEIKGKWVRSIGKLFLIGESDPVIIDTQAIYNPFLGKTKREKRYAPYEMV